MKWPADRISNSVEKSFGMYDKAAELEKTGVDLIHLEVGRPNFDTPAHIKQATKDALDAGKVHYGEFPGELHFRQAIAVKLLRDNKIDVGVDEILVTSGLTQNVFAVCMAAIDPGDEVLVLDPFYPQHVAKVQLAGGVIVPVPLADDFRISAAAIRGKITPKTRMIALVNPSNPTGRVFSRGELQALANIAIEFDLLVIADEVYEQKVFDDHSHISIASLPGMHDRTFSMFAFTKGYAMDGWRLGYLVAPRAMMTAILTVTINDMPHVNVFIQDGGHAAITGPQHCVAEMLAEDKRRRDLLVDRMNRMPGVVCPRPQGSIYAFPDISATGIASQQLAERILSECEVVVEAGSFYGEQGEGYLRVCFGSEPYERIEQAMDRLEYFFAGLAV